MVGSFLVRHLFLIAAVSFVLILIALNTLIPLGPSASEYPFKLAITLEKTSYKTAEPITITWTLTNIGEENVTLLFGNDFLGDFIIQDDNFNVVYHEVANAVWAAIYYAYPELPPDRNFTRTVTWYQDYDGITKKHVPSGTYWVSGYFKGFSYPVTLETPPLKITIEG
jgi:hypothetical protein